MTEDPANAADFSLDTPPTPLCASHALQCAGDPFRDAAVDDSYGGVGAREAVTY